MERLHTQSEPIRARGAAPIDVTDLAPAASGLSVATVIAIAAPTACIAALYFYLTGGSW